MSTSCYKPMYDLHGFAPVVKPPLDPDPDCRWCRGTGEVILATTTRPCLDCLAPWKGWVWEDENQDAPTVFYVDMDGREVEVNAVYDAASGELPDGAVCVGRLSRYSRPGRNQHRDRKILAMPRDAGVKPQSRLT